MIATSNIIASAQSCVNYISVNETRISEPSACYFLQYGDKSNAFANADILATALQAEVTINQNDTNNSFVIFARDNARIRLKSTEIVEDGLVKQAGTLQILTTDTDEKLESPMAIYHNNKHYVPVAPVVRALGGSAYWLSETRTVGILIKPLEQTSHTNQSNNNANSTTAETAAQTPAITAADIQAIASNLASQSDRQQAHSDTNFQDSTVTNEDQSTAITKQGMANQTQAITNSPDENSSTNDNNMAKNNTASVSLGEPRIGIYDDHARLALDLPENISYRILLGKEIKETNTNSNYNTLVVQFLDKSNQPLTIPKVQLQKQSELALTENPYIHAWYYQTFVDNGYPTLALIIDVLHELTPSGKGLKIGFLAKDKNRANNVFYIDFAPTEQGSTLETTALTNLNPLDATLFSNNESSEGLGSSNNSSEELNNSEVTTENANNNKDNNETNKPENVEISETNETQNEDARAPQQSSPQRTVVIDPGHGGVDPGAQGYASEEDVVLDVALRLRPLLEDAGIKVIMSRDADYSLKDEKRADLAARAAMTSTDRNLFVSIHANSAENKNAQGVETWIFGEPLDEYLIQNAITENGGGSVGITLTAEAKEVHDSILNDIFRQEQMYYSTALAEAVQSNMIAATGAKDRGIRKNYFFVIRNARIPAVLVEVGFVSNPEEGKNLATAAYRNKIAKGLAKGIIEFFEQEGVHVQQD